MTASSSQRRDWATARAHRAQGTQNRPFRDREPAPPWQRHPEPERDWDRRSLRHATTCSNMNGSHRWRCAAQADQEHLTALTGYNSLPLRLSCIGWASTVKPTNRGAREGTVFSTKPETKAKDNPPQLLERATERHSMEYPKRLVEAEARTKSAFRKRKTHGVCPEELHWAPTKFWRTRETIQEGWQTGQYPCTTRNDAGSVRTQKNVRTRHFKTRTVRAEWQSLKGRDWQTPPRHRGDIHAKRKGVAWSNARTATPKTEATTSRPGEEWGRESEAPWTYTSSPYREVRLPEEPLASPHAWKTSAWNAQVKRITARLPKQTNPQGRARSNSDRRRRAKAHSFVG